jgi:hypothetical protein
MKLAPPLFFQWDGEAMTPTGRFRKEADRHYVIGEKYLLKQIPPQASGLSRRHQFAWLDDAWESLPDELADLFVTPEHLRKRALIRKGFCRVRDYPCMTQAEAERLRVALREEGDEYDMVRREGTVVRVYKAKSQKSEAMDHAEFQASKNAVMEYVADLLGVPVDDLKAIDEAKRKPKSA